MVPPALNVASVVWSLGTGRSRLMSQHPSDEEVDSYASFYGGIPANGAPRRVLVAAFRQVVGVVPQTSVAPSSVPVRPPIEKLRKYGVVEFMGKKDDVASTAEYWLRSLERILEQMQCSP
ncbi:hypothetical protein JCGZ_10624 [Jatropha curcas]|uniref:Uncharacterized protein n=1 Tax=Jatropha curcas TaxID=180498 RepID=A0A067KU72_JATCU|nr:hypothetical protein JCGZ_10624 [Jatropha curcas]